MQDRARLLAVVLFLVRIAPLAAQQPAWEVTLERDSVTPSTITATVASSVNSISGPMNRHGPHHGAQ